MDEVKTEKKKIAILGGGMAALTAAFELTSSPALRERFEVTVYQLGWRLGGKGASGRNRERADRIEEHGLHVLMGSYHNAFSLLRACYEELGRPAGAPLATIEEAIKPHGFIVAADRVGEGWEPWPLSFPPLPGKPGVDASAHLHPWGYLKRILSWMYGLFHREPELVSLVPDRRDADADVDALLTGRRGPAEVAAPGRRTRGEDGPTRGAPAVSAAVDPARIDPSRLAGLIDDLRGAGDQRREPMTRSSVAASAYLYLAHLVGEVGLGSPGPRVVWLLEGFRGWLQSVLAPRSPGSLALRRLWILLDLGLTTVLGALRDGVDRAPEGWFSLDDHDLRAWLKLHGASELTWDSALVRSIYNVAFTAPGQAAAGTAIHGVLQMVFSCKEAIFQKMQAGMGDTIFAPLYLVLERRGVKFEFFHRVHELVVSPGGDRIEAIVMGRQVRLQGPAYTPLYDVGGLPCWPSAPLHEQIAGGEALRESGQDLESWWCTWPEAEERRLSLGRDFDAVVLGLSIGALPTVCRQLVAASPRFAAMVAHVKTTATQALQLWLRTDLRGLGWRLEAPVLDGFAEPFDTWADMSHLLPRERWPERDPPRQLAYLCSLLEDDGEAPPPRTAPEYPARQDDRVRANAESWLTGQVGGLWPGASRAGGTFDWSLLFDLEDRSGARRLEAQYLQASSNPSDRYVLSVPGSHRHRLRAGESGFENLVLAGDWVRTGMSAGCVEAAVMAGMGASRALSGHPLSIPGDDLETGRRGEGSAMERYLPQYIERGGDLVVRQPLELHGVTIHSFLLSADTDRLAALVARQLNAPAQGAVEYVPAAPVVALVCADIQRGQARDDPDRSKGWMSERDVAFWVPLWAGRRTGGVFLPERLVFFMPYVFVDNVAAMVTGREVFGFPKESGVLAFPEPARSPGSFSVETLVIRRYDRDARAEVARLVEVAPAEARHPAPAHDTWTDLEEGAHAFAGRLRELLVKDALTPAVDALLHAMKAAPGLGARLVFLKQFRDVEDPSRACYQAVVEAPATVTALRGGGVLPPHVVRITPADSHPIIAELGLAGATCPTLLASWVDVDFTMERGSSVHRTTG